MNWWRRLDPVPGGKPPQVAFHRGLCAACFVPFELEICPEGDQLHRVTETLAGVWEMSSLPRPVCQEPVLLGVNGGPLRPSPPRVLWFCPVRETASSSSVPASATLALGMELILQEMRNVHGPPFPGGS